MVDTDARTIIAVVSGPEGRRRVLDRAIERARDDGATVILFDVDAPPSPLESPLPTDWSGEGEEELYGDRLGPRELYMAGRADLARMVESVRASGMRAFGWLPEKADAETLAQYARDQGASAVLLPGKDRNLGTNLEVSAEIVEDGSG